MMTEDHFTDRSGMAGPRDDAFVALFDAHYRTVLGYLTRRVNAPADAQEIAGDVFRVAWQKQDPVAPFGRSWLLKVASDRLKDYYRRAGVRGEVEAALMRRLTEAPSQLGMEDQVEVRLALTKLSVREQEALRLTYWEGLAADEVANVLGCSTAAVWTLLTRSRTKLRGLLGQLPLKGDVR